MENNNSSSKQLGTPKHLKAMKVHRFLALLYLGIAVAFLILASAQSGFSFKFLIFPLILLCFTSLPHGLIAYGASKANPTAKRFSKFVAVLLLFGFPIGTAIGAYLLMNSSWENPTNESEAIGSA